MQNSNVLVYGKIPVKNALLSDSKVKTLYLKREDIPLWQTSRQNY